MKKGLVAAIAVVAVVIIIVAVALRANHKSYVQVIPASAVAVAYVDLPEIIEESGMDAAALDTLLGADARLQDVGIDFSEKAYGFVSQEGIPALVLSVDDAGKLRAFLNRMHTSGRCSATESLQGYEWATWADSYLVGFNSEACMIMGPSIAAAQSELRQMMLSYFNQPKGERAVSTPMFDRLKDQKGLVALIGKIEMVPSFYSLLHAAGLTFDADSGDFLLTATLDSKDNRLCFHADVESSDKQFERQLEQLLSMFGPIDGDLLHDVAPDAYAWCGVHVDGEKLVSELRKNNTFLMFLMMANHVFDAESLMKNIDGDCAGFPTGAEGSYVFVSEMKDKQILKGASEWAEHSTPEMLLNWYQGVFTVRTSSFESQIGMLHDDYLFVATGQPGRFVAEPSQWQSSKLDPYRQEIEGSLFYLWLDVHGAWEANQPLIDSFGGLVPVLQEKDFGGLDAVTLRMKDVNSLDVNFIFKKGVAPIRQIMGY